MFRSFFPRNEHAAPQTDDWEAQLVWLPVGHAANPFDGEVLDCRAVALAFTSMTSDQSVAESFNRLRASDGRETWGRLPEQAIVVDCELRFPYSGRHEEGPLFIAREMEDKWDFFAYDHQLYIRRSWTGQLIHVAEVEYTADAVLIRRIHSEPNTVRGAGDFAVEQVHFLITTHLSGKLTPFPIPPDVSRSEVRAIALAGFNAYGRRGQFASYGYHRTQT